VSKRFSLILAVVLSLPLLPVGPAEAQSYPLTCQIGTMNQVLMDIVDGWGGIYFTKSTRPASSGLSPGQCGWNDRGMLTSEPALLCFQGIGISNITLKGATLSNLPPCLIVDHFGV
jgi:hypothetical protein